jgi:serine/threonine-protein kinase RsbT
VEFVSYNIESMDFRQAGGASRGLKERLKLIGADAEAIRRTMIAAYEAEMNVVIHSVGGRLEAALTASQVDVNVVDTGPGIPDIEKAMEEGFSTASAEARSLGFGAGLGLPNIRRNSDRLRLTSHVGEGTRVSFTIYLRPGQTDGSRPISLCASPDRCRDCRACLTACPTRAMRVRDGMPSVLEHLCIDCAACIAACTSEALNMREEISSLDDLANKGEMLLVVPTALLAGCGADHPPALVLAALRDLGFAGVMTSAPWEQAVREAAVALAAGPEAVAATDGAAPATEEAPAAATDRAQPAAAAAAPRPIIAPSCPAAVNLIELRFPSLVPHLAPVDSPWEAVQATHGDRPVTYVVSCPSQRSALLAHDEAGARGGPAPKAQPTRGAEGEPADRRAEYLSPEVVRQAVMMRLTGGAASLDARASSEAPLGAVVGAAPGAASDASDAASANSGASRAAGATPGADSDSLLTVTGAAHVIAVLEALEDGLLSDVPVVDPYMCEGGCFGSPLLSEDYHIAARRWAQGLAAVEATAGRPAPGGTAVRAERAPAPAATPRRRPFAARPGIRLDADMGRAIEKLGRLQAITEELPGKDCGVCGAPACAALAEDVVMQRTVAHLCPYVKPGNKEDRER